MKKLLYFLIFLNIGTYCFSQDQEKLPAKPWEEIVAINSSEQVPIIKWNTDIYVNLEGDYTESDSINIAKILKKLDALTETISIKFSKSSASNFQIKFLDTFINSGFGRKNRIQGRFNMGLKKEHESGELFISPYFAKTDSNFNYHLELHLAKTLVGGYFPYGNPYEKRESIFNRTSYNNSIVSLNNEDIAIIKAVYRKGFEERLASAEKQFKNILKKIQEDKISSRDRRLWWVRNPVSIIFLPTLILVLLALFLINKANKSISVKIKKDWLRFGVVALIALLFAGILIVFCVSFYDFLTIPDNYQLSPIIRNDTIISITISLFILFPFLYLFRFIELKIQKISKSIFIKTTLVFLSTALLPFICLLSVFLIAFRDVTTNQNEYLFLSQVFLFLMLIATFRALIGYFIFKERSLIVENEMKLSNLRELKTKAELKSLQSQINPHFLYNSLNSIASLAPVDAIKTQKMAHSLSDLFKYSINRKNKKTSTILDEVTMVKTYLDIEKIRFGDRLQFSVDVAKDLENTEIPLFLIQPLVENAVKHGISQNEGKGKIVLKITRETNNIHIIVSDNGPDFPEGLVSGHGLQTVYDLLRLSYGDTASLNWTNTPEKMITITIPETI